MAELVGRHAPPEVIDAALPVISAALAGVSRPKRAIIGIDKLLHAVEDPAAVVRVLGAEPRLTESLCVLFCGSHFLGESLVRNPATIWRLRDPVKLAQPTPRDHVIARTQLIVQENGSLAATLDALRRWQRDETLRIGIGDLLGLVDVQAVTRQLSNLADAMAQACLAAVAREIGCDPSGFCVLALGKLGGAELNYSSDIDLIFVVRAEPGRYVRLGTGLIDALGRATGEGFLYRVDMRLRPWGRAGALVVSLDGYRRYLERDARLWEKQAMIKARPIAGDMSVGREALAQAQPVLYRVDRQTLRADVAEMKRRIEGQLRRHGQEWGEVKRGIGSIRDVEFVTQYLQLRHGERYPDVRSANTLDGLARLRRHGLLGAREYRILADGYAFLRPVEHHLQIMNDQQTHSLPAERAELDDLGRRLGFAGEAAGDLFLTRYQQHSAAIRAVYRRYLDHDDRETRHVNDDQRPTPDAAPSGPLPATCDRMSASADSMSVSVRRHIARMAPAYAATFDEDEIARHAERVDRLGPQNLVEIDAVPIAGNQWRVTIVAYDCPGELSMICGLLFCGGLSIVDGDVFTYEEADEADKAPSQPARHNASLHRRRTRGRRRITYRLPSKDDASPGGPSDGFKIVDVFRVQADRELPEGFWATYEQDLEALLRLARAGQAQEAQGQVAARVAAIFDDMPGRTDTLSPIDIEIDNDTSDRYTMLDIDASDTIGFLYELTNAMALANLNVVRVTVDSVGSRVRDTFYLTDDRGAKIVDPARQRELRATTVLVKHFTHLLTLSPNPAGSLVHFREFLAELFAREDWPDELASVDKPRVLGALARLLGVSDFLWDDFLRMQYANLFPVVRDVDDLADARPIEALRDELASALAIADGPEKRVAALNAFKDREMFRVDMRHIQGHIREFGQFSRELTDIAEVVIDGAQRMAYGALRRAYGEPTLPDGSPCPLAVCALGKTGGRELGYASDIELMFVYAGGGSTSGPESISNSDLYARLVRELLGAIRARREGIFELDLRLRPYGSAGSLAVSLDSFQRYFGPEGDAWPYERQALVKLRPIAGDATFGARVVALRDDMVYREGAFDVGAMRAMRERQLRHLVTPGTINTKFSPGGLVDIEYLVQGLQMTHGVDHPEVRLTNVRQAMAALADLGVLSAEAHAVLRAAHAFMRELIDALRMVRGNAKDLTVPPRGSEELAFLARRLGYDAQGARLQDDIARHTARVQELSELLLGQ